MKVGEHWKPVLGTAAVVGGYLAKGPEIAQAAANAFEYAKGNAGYWYEEWKKGNISLDKFMEMFKNKGGNQGGNQGQVFPPDYFYNIQENAHVPPIIQGGGFGESGTNPPLIRDNPGEVQSGYEVPKNMSRKQNFFEETFKSNKFQKANDDEIKMRERMNTLFNYEKRYKGNSLGMVFNNQKHKDRNVKEWKKRGSMYDLFGK